MSGKTLSQILDTAEETATGPRFDVPENWKQGRTAYGGFTSALMLAAARGRTTDLPPLRSALINFTAPVSASPEFVVETFRQGRNVTTVNVRALIQQQVAAQGTFSFGVAQNSHVAQACPAPAAQTPEQTAPLFPPEMPRLPAQFFENFEACRIEGDLPFAGAERGYLRVWVRYRDAEMWDRPEALIGIADVLPPAVFPICRRPGPNSSMTWICNFLSGAPATRDGWWMMETDLTAARDGYSSQVMRVWNTDGELVVEGMQSVVIFV
ncbi:thioesterase family protein [Rhodobacteraceae bacterium F11138]|nr:thioesterase family protein [Rhodobacteraceae bacterium F11138]